MDKTTIYLDGYCLTRTEIERVAYNQATVDISQESRVRIRESRAHIERCLDQGDVIYGVNTGFGELSKIRIKDEDIQKLQVNLLRADAVGVGDKFSTAIVRGIMLLRINALTKGFSGVREETVQLLVDMLNQQVHPLVPSKGSVGASGDLAPLAHVAITLIGEGKVEYKNKIYSGHDGLAAAGLTPLILESKEGLALINGTQAMTSIATLTLNKVERIGIAADMSASLTMEALRSVITAFDSNFLEVRPHGEFEEVSSRIRQWLEGSKRITEQGEIRVQDAYSIRCIPQVHGASWQTFKYVKERVEVEINSATDNPIILQNGKIISGGHFHGQPIALAMDFMKVAVAELGNIAERRIERLVNPQLSGLPAFLANNPGLECGLMVAQYTAAALVSENKVLSHPASVDSIPTSANQEDHVSMGTIASRQAEEIAHNVARVIAIEMICASQAIYLEKCETDLAKGTRKYLTKIRNICPPLLEDRDISAEIDNLAISILMDDIM